MVSWTVLKAQLIYISTDQTLVQKHFKVGQNFLQANVESDFQKHWITIDSKGIFYRFMAP